MIRCPECGHTHIRMHMTHIPPLEGEYGCTCMKCGEQFNLREETDNEQDRKDPDLD